MDRHSYHLHFIKKKMIHIPLLKPGEQFYFIVRFSLTTVTAVLKISHEKLQYITFFEIM